MKNRFFIFMFGCMLCAGCVTNRSWYNPNKSLALQKQDIRNCRAEAKEQGNVPYSSQNDPFFTGDGSDEPEIYRGEAESRINDLYRQCLQRLGYALYSNDDILRLESEKTKQ